MATFIFGSGLRPAERDITDQVVDEESPEFWDWLDDERDNPLSPLPDESPEADGDEASDTASA
jgi:hypothetical protein